MTTRERIDSDYVQSAKARDAFAVSVLRQMRAALKSAEIDKMKPLEEADVIETLGREAKKIRDAVESYRAGQRQDLVDQAEKEIAFIERYLPEQLSDEELAAIAEAKVAALAPVTAKDFGRVMAEVMKEAKGRADGAKVSAAVKKVLSGS
ncbi:MAG: GatB/YqeY domain-containing protein [Patescibacteria group bacterium]|nr:GatB/YqeY domain-containing protein [Patescibacteria group bacterium]